MPRILIDPGHGGHAPIGGSTPIGGCSASGIREKDVTLDLAQRVCARLGPDAALTRSGDTNLPLAERARMARQYGAKVFLSLHANSADPDRQGAQTWVHSQAGYGSRRLAGTVQGALTPTDRADAGVFAADFGVLRPESLGGDVDACLVEVDYLTHPYGERTLTDPASVERIAGVIASAVQNHMGSGAYGTPTGMFDAYRQGATGFDALDAPQVKWGDWRATLRQLSAWMANGVRYENVPVENTDQYPFNAICKIERSDGGAGSGFFIGPNTILTAGHMVTDRSNNKIGSLTIYQALNNNRAAIRSFSVAAADFDPYPSYRPGTQDYDIAVIRTGSNESFTYFDIEEQVMNPVSGVTICGYAHGHDVQRIDTDSIRNVHDNTYTYRAETRHGTSGSPVFYINGEQAIATGVHISGVDMQDRPASGEINVGCRLTNEKLTWIQNHAGSQGLGRNAHFGAVQVRPLDKLGPPSVDWSSPGAALRQLAGWLVNRVRYEAIPVGNTNQYPFNAICKIETNGGLGSGFFIGPNTILTAAHVVRGESGASIYQALNDNKASSRGITVSSSAFAIHPSADIAVIRTGSYESASHFQVEELRFNPQGGIAICGYAYGADVQRMDTDTVHELSNGELVYAAETRGGTSGSPVFYTDGNNAIAVGVHVNAGSGARSNNGVQLTNALILWIEGNADNRGISSAQGYGGHYGGVGTQGQWERYS